MKLYQALDRFFPTSFAAKVQVLAGAAIGLPTLILLLYALIAPAGVGTGGLILLILATIVALALGLAGLKAVLAPIHLASAALAAQAAGQKPPALPREFKDEAGQVMAGLRHLKEQSESTARKTEAAADHDALTGLFNRRGFEKRFEKQRESGLRGAFLIVDIDHFRRINDTHGYAQGDAVLAAVAEAVREEIRGTDLIARFGGEEVVVFLSGATQPGALTRAEAIREKIAGLTVSPAGPMTASVGVAIAIGHREEFRTLYARADQALAEAKAAGRDRVQVAGVTMKSSG